MTPAKKRRNLYTSSSEYRNWPRLGLWAVGLCSLGLAGLGAGLCKRNSVLNVALYAQLSKPFYLHRYKGYLMGYNSVADNTGLSSFV